MYEDAPPLKVWAYSAIVLCTFLFLFLLYTYLGFGPYAKALERSHRSLEDALIENNTRDTSAISVVIVGSSLTERAFVDPKEIADRIAAQTNRKTNVLRVAIYYMNMDLAERINFFGYIIRYPPQYLFIENLAFNFDANNAGIAIPVPIDAVLLDLRNRFRRTVGAEPHENYYTRWYTFDRQPLSENIFYTDKFDSAMFKSLLTKKNKVRKVSQQSIANRAYEALMKNHTKIIFLDMPQSDKFQANFLDKSSTAEFNKVLEVYHQQYNIDYWQYPGVMNDSCYTDGAHFNYKGAMKYQDWFVSKFASIK